MLVAGQTLPNSLSMPTGNFTVTRLSESSLRVELSGDWHLRRDLPSPDPVIKAIASARQPATLSIAANKLGAWDSGLLIFLKPIADSCRDRHIAIDLGQLPAGVTRLVQLSEAVPERKGARSVDHVP